MPANILSAGIDLDTLFAPIAGANAVVTNTGYQAIGSDLRLRYDPIANPNSQSNLGSRIPDVNLTTNGTNLSALFCGNVGQYALTAPVGASKTQVGWVTPRTLTYSMTVTFASAAAMTNYFYYGGRILIDPGHTTGTLADNTLSTALANAGIIVIYDLGHYRTGTTGTVSNPAMGAVNATISPTTFYSVNDGSPYTASYFDIRVLQNAAAGSATALTVIMRLVTVRAGTVNDTYSGTFSLNIQQRNHPTQAVPVFSGSLLLT